MTDKKVQNNKFVWIKDKNNKWNKWDIYDETDKSYKVRASHGERFITEIYKCKIYMDGNGDLYSLENRNQFSVIPNGYAKSKFAEFKFKKGEC